jgi:hypothetical protein
VLFVLSTVPVQVVSSGPKTLQEMICASMRIGRAKRDFLSRSALFRLRTKTIANPKVARRFSIVSKLLMHPRSQNLAFRGYYRLTGNYKNEQLQILRSSAQDDSVGGKVMGG